MNYFINSKSFICIQLFVGMFIYYLYIYLYIFRCPFDIEIFFENFGSIFSNLDQTFFEFY
jgi:hypothetical protein